MQIAEQSNSAEQSGSVTASPISVVHAATGPRTPGGKQNSKHNALKHGIFSKVVLLKEEPRAEFNSLVRGLRNDLKPEGTLEELLVDNLVAISWRKRRLLIAEGAEIRKGTEFVDSDVLRRANDDHVSILQAGCPLMSRTANNRVLNTCIELLAALKASIGKENFDEVLAENIIILLYRKNGSETLLTRAFGGYLKSLRVTRRNASVAHESDSSHLADYEHDLLVLLEEEIRGLKYLQCEQLLEENNRIEIEWHRGNVPDAPQLDRLLRYETTLQRDFDRTLSQLERLQRIRKGQPVSPTLNVHVSS